MSDRHVHRHPPRAVLAARLLATLALAAAASSADATAPRTLSLDGTTGYVRVPNADALNPSGAVTFEAWVRRRNSSRCETIVGKDYFTSYWLGFCDNSSLGRNVLRFYTHGLGTAQDGDVVVPAGTWTHVAVTFDGTTRRYYVNGLLLYESTSPRTLPVSATDLTIGADRGGSYPFSGSLAEVRMWSVARSLTAIRQDMVRLIDGPRPGLVGVWHLEGDAREAMGRRDGTLVGGATFTGSAAPPLDHGPVLIPRVDTAPMGGPTVDGNCQPGEYGDVRVPVWHGTAYTLSALDWVYLGATATDFYLCLQSPRASGGADVFRVYLDTNGDGVDPARAGDYRIGVRPDDTTSTEQGNGAGGFAAPGLWNFAADAASFEFDWTAELRVGREVLPPPGMSFRLGVTRTTGAVTDPWPVGFSTTWPSRWAEVQFADESSLPRPDGANPRVEASHAPEPIVRRDDVVTITATAAEDVDIASIDILVDGVIRQSCPFPGDDDRAGTCVLAEAQDVGSHSYYASVSDHRGRLGFSPLRTFFVLVDGQAPAITVHHSPPTPSSGEDVVIEATATDPSGLRSLRVVLDSRAEDCAVPAGATTATCAVPLVPAAGTRILYYTVLARDAEGFEAMAGPIAILFGNVGTDTDGDGIVDAIENLTCTSPTNADSDHDSLPDGWELLGLRFPEGDSLNLPAMGAHPCRRDLFVRLAYDASVPYTADQIQTAVNMFRRKEMELHVETKEHPAPPPDTESTSVAGGVATERDADGAYYYPPRFNWTHYFVFARYRVGRSWNSGRFTTIDMRVSDQVYRLVHELGHGLGLGHGGRQGSDAQRSRGPLIYYEGEWDSLNRKSNYNSVMNYRWPSFCRNSASGDFRGEIDYSSVALPTLDERSLDERTGSDFARAVRATDCGTGFTPVVVYTCDDPDEDGTAYMMISDTTRTVARLRDGSDWQTTGLPTHPAGIDWNCDGAIEASVGENINGDGGDNELPDPFPAPGDTLVGRADWPVLAGGRSCTALSATRFPADYVAAIGGPSCDEVASLEAVPEPATADGHPATFPLLELPGIEVCDGLNNDGDLEVDEGCPDRDADGVKDFQDNCPQTPNADQADRDGDRLGDACQKPQAKDLVIAGRTETTIQLKWKVVGSDVRGFNVYRQESGRGELALRGGRFPSTRVASYFDQFPPGSGYRYIVRAVSLNGVEGPGAEVTVGPFVPPAAPVRAR